MSQFLAKFTLSDNTDIEQLNIVEGKTEMETFSNKGPKAEQTNHSSDLQLDSYLPQDFAFQAARQTTEYSSFLTVLLLETSSQN